MVKLWTDKNTPDFQQKKTFISQSTNPLYTNGFFLLV